MNSNSNQNNQHMQRIASATMLAGLANQAVFGGSGAVNIPQREAQQMIACSNYNSNQQPLENMGMAWSNCHPQPPQQPQSHQQHAAAAAAALAAQHQAQQQFNAALQDTLAAHTVYATVQQIRQQLGQQQQQQQQLQQQQQQQPQPQIPQIHVENHSRRYAGSARVSAQAGSEVAKSGATAADEVKAFAAAWLRARSRLVVAAPSSYYSFGASSSSIVADLTSRLSCEVINTIFQYLSRSQLVTAMRVCRRWHVIIVNTRSLWHSVDMSKCQLSLGQVCRLLQRGTQIGRIAWSRISDDQGVNPAISNADFLLPQQQPCQNVFSIQYLDLTGVTATPATLTMILGHCKCLKKLSLEACELNDNCLYAIGENRDLEVLNLTMATGISPGALRHAACSLRNLTELNLASSSDWLIASHHESESSGFEQVSFVLETLPSSLSALNLSGLPDLSDADAQAVARVCPSLSELDLSDCRSLTVTGLRAIARHLSSSLTCLGISRCFGLELADLIALTALPRLERLKVHSFGGQGADNWLAALLPSTAINQSEHILSTVARPTVGDRRTSIWGLRTRDIR